MNGWDFAAAHPWSAVLLVVAAGWAGSRIVVAIGQAIRLVARGTSREP